MNRLITTFIVAVAIETILMLPAGAVINSQSLCPSGMVSIDNKYCIDKYEYPNKKGEYSQNAVTRESAARSCASAGKYLCKGEEWRKACRGPNDKLYPYGNTYKKGECSDPYAENGQGHYPSGDWENCVNGYGVYDMSGNLWEWTADDRGDGFGEIRGGGAASIDSDELSCDTLLMEKTNASDEYIGFRCCSDVTDRNLNGGASNLLGAVPSKFQEGFYQSYEYRSMDDIMRNVEKNSSLSTGGAAITTGYQFSSAKVDFTRMEYKVKSTRRGVTTNTNVSADVVNVGLLVPSMLRPGKWAKYYSVGMRYLDADAGNLKEYYLTRDLIRGNWTITPGLNYVENREIGSRQGYSVNVAGRLTNHLNLTWQYKDADFFKNFLNDYIVPLTTNYKYLNCDNCHKNTASAGLIYMLPGNRGNLSLMYYDYGDLKVPVGGTTINF